MFAQIGVPVVGEPPKLTAERVAMNSARGVRTMLVCDTNILLAMQKLMKAGWTDEAAERLRLLPLVELIRQSEDITLEYGQMLQELDPATRGRAETIFERFLERMRLGATLAGGKARPIEPFVPIEAPTIDSWDAKAQRVFGAIYLWAMCLILLARDPRPDPVTRYLEFARTVEKHGGVIGEQAFAIARAVAIHQTPAMLATLPEEERDLLGRLATNFAAVGQDLKTLHDFKRAAFNIMNDLRLPNTVLVLMARQTDKEFWIASLDGKLLSLLDICEYPQLDPANAGKYFALKEHHAYTRTLEYARMMAETMILRAGPRSEVIKFGDPRWQGIFKKIYALFEDGASRRK